MNAERKLLVIPSWYPPDGGYFFKEHCEALKKAGLEVDVLVNRVIGIRKLRKLFRDGWWKFRIRNEAGLRVIRSIYLKIPGNENLNIKRWSKQTARLFDRYIREVSKPDIILAHSATWAGYAAALINKKHGIPCIITEHRSFFVFTTRASREMIRPYYIPYFREAYSRCKKLVLVSSSMKKGILEFFPDLAGKISVIPNMVNTNWFTMPGKKRETDPFVFIFAGRLAHVKGLDILITAFRELTDGIGGHLVLKIMGKGEDRKKLEEMVHSCGLTGKVQFLGRVSREQVVAELHQANCFVLPSRYEAFGVVLIEAMSTGLPVIATRSGGPEDIVNERVGYLVQPDQPAVLKEAMEKMIRSYDQFDQQAIREYVQEDYSNDAMVYRYVEILS
jgi:glycosyltransferase involved in cell wall biosynthesis